MHAYWMYKKKYTYIYLPNYMIRVNDEHSSICIADVSTQISYRPCFAIFTYSKEEQVFRGSRTPIAYLEYDNIPLIRFHEQFSKTKFKTSLRTWKLKCFKFIEHFFSFQGKSMILIIFFSSHIATFFFMKRSELWASTPI